MQTYLDYEGADLEAELNWHGSHMGGPCIITGLKAHFEIRYHDGKVETFNGVERLRII